MTHLMALQEDVQRTVEALSRLEHEFVADPYSPALRAVQRSLEKRFEREEAAFLGAAERLEIDVCRYRLFYAVERPRLSTVAESLRQFQRLFSVVYDALLYGPRRRRTINENVASQTEFGVAYSFAGSLGVVLTLPNERLLFNSHLDDAMNRLCEVAGSSSPEEVATFARNLGAPVIRTLFDWAETHAQANIGADIQWVRGEEVRSRFLIQEPEIRRLHNTLAMTSEETEAVVRVEGVLVGADVKNRTFHLVPETGELRGHFLDAITEEQTVELPKRYLATLRKTTRTVYARGEEEVRYMLIGLEDV